MCSYNVAYIYVDDVRNAPNISEDIGLITCRSYKQAINGHTIFDYTFWENASDTSTSATYVNKYFTVGSNKKEIFRIC